MIMAHYFFHLDLRDIIDSPPKLKAPKPILLRTRRAGLISIQPGRNNNSQVQSRKIVKQKITADAICSTEKSENKNSVKLQQCNNKSKRFDEFLLCRDSPKSFCTFISARKEFFREIVKGQIVFRFFKERSPNLIQFSTVSENLLLQ